MNGNFHEIHENEAHIWFATIDHEPCNMETGKESPSLMKGGDRGGLEDFSTLNNPHLTSPFIRGRNYTHFLSSDELLRAQRFRSDRDRRTFLYARTTLKRLLSRYVNCDPQELSIAYNTHGKPYLKNCDLKFNLSHSRDAVFYAFSMDREIGIDVESLDRKADYLGLAKRFFTRDEAEFLESVPGGLRASFFFRLWTSKEAYVKARGKGLMLSLSSPVAPGWMVQNLNASEEYAVALAIEGEPCTIKHFCWNQ